MRSQDHYHLSLHHPILIALLLGQLLYPQVLLLLPYFLLTRVILHRFARRHKLVVLFGQGTCQLQMSFRMRRQVMRLRLQVERALTFQLLFSGTQKGQT
jgi:hypothetical protein